MPIPEKYFYTIGDITQMTGVKPHILRYWESKFRLLRPARRYSGHRKYTQRDIDLIRRIKYFLIDRKLTLAGAKQEISRQLNRSKEPLQNAPESLQTLSALREIKKDIEECLDLLHEPHYQQQEFASLK